MRSLATCLLIAASLPSNRADAQIPERRLGVNWRGTAPHLDFSAQDLLDDRRVHEQIESGLPRDIVIRLYAYLEGREQSVAFVARTCRVTHDLWELVYRVQLTTAAGSRTVSVPTLAEVVQRCLIVRNQPVGAAADFHTGERVYFAVLVEFAPLSTATVQRIRRWIARGGSTAGVNDEAFFGSFVSLFVNRRIGQAQRTVRFRSQVIAVP